MFDDTLQRKRFKESKMEWISVKDGLPCNVEARDCERDFVLAYHTIFGVGVAWFWVFEEEEWPRTELEEDFKDRYICSCQFIKSRPDGNYCIDEEDDIDIFEHSPHFFNLGTVTHWMPLPKPPKE